MSSLVITPLLTDVLRCCKAVIALLTHTALPRKLGCALLWAALR